LNLVAGGFAREGGEQIGVGLVEVLPAEFAADVHSLASAGGSDQEQMGEGLDA